MGAAPTNSASGGCSTVPKSKETLHMEEYMATVSSPKITPFLWFNDNAQEAVLFYTSVFKNSKVIQSNPMVSTFELEGQRLMALNGGPMYQFTEAFSLFVSCETQEEVDYYWNALLRDGGTESRCGWLKDKYGLSWQIVPVILNELLSDPDPRKSDKVMQAMLKMVKLDVEGLKKAYKKN
jgi:predicted 3-demethylubiquinone-9 3-methyltransferase (glyoxalase superfamily)